MHKLLGAHRRARVLFVLKLRDGYGSDYGDPCPRPHDNLKPISSGLLNSAVFVSDMLREAGIDSRVVQVIDNNCIDREVTAFRPTHVIIEALWVVPEKFEVLRKRHPHVKWIVRIHSEIAFLANEGVAVDWLIRYVRIPNVYVSSNSQLADEDLHEIIYDGNPNWNVDQVEAKVIYLPNFYPAHLPHHKAGKSFADRHLDIVCFGAIRPLKNQLIQALAAIQFAEESDKTLRFHINSERTEQGGEKVLKNIRALFANSGHQLVEHDWMNHSDFLNCLSGKDLGMQVTLSETFCIVAADMVTVGLPIVVSPRVRWANEMSFADPYDRQAIVDTMHKVTGWPWRNLLINWNKKGLRRYAETSRKVWLAYFGGK